MIDWNDNAKAAVNAYNNWALENDLGIHTFFEHLTNNGHTQQKTVEDAVEWAKGKLPKNSEWTHIRACKRLGAFFFADGNPDGNKWDSSDFICTREQFEACAAKKGEKWTHVVDDDEGQLTKCRKHLKLCNGSDWVYVCEKGEYFVPSKMGYCGVKPIKPTLSESEAWRKVRDGHSVEFVMKKYDII